MPAFQRIFPLAVCSFLIVLSVHFRSQSTNTAVIVSNQVDGISLRDVQFVSPSASFEFDSESQTSQTPVTPPANVTAVSTSSPWNPVLFSLPATVCKRPLHNRTRLPIRNIKGRTATVAMDVKSRNITLECGEEVMTATLVAPILSGRTKRVTRIKIPVSNSTDTDREAVLLSPQSGTSSPLVCASLQYAVKLPEIQQSSNSSISSTFPFLSSPRVLYACETTVRPWYILEYLPGWNLQDLSRDYAFGNRQRCHFSRGIIAYVRTLRHAGDSDCDLHLGNFVAFNITKRNIDTPLLPKLFAFDFDCVVPSASVASARCCSPRQSQVIDSSCFSAVPESPADDDCRAVSILQRLFDRTPSPHLRNAFANVPLRDTTLDELQAIVTKECARFLL